MTPRPLVDATGTRRRLEALAALGWSATQIGRHLGRPHASSRSLISSWKHRDRTVIDAGTAAQVAAVYEQLHTRPGPCSKVRVQALKGGCLPPEAWADVDIDSPEALPATGEEWLANERWLPVVGYEGMYEVSDKGRVRSLDRIVEYPDDRPGYFRPGRLLSASLTKAGGYLQVTLTRDGVCRTKKVHILVLEAFRGPRPEGMKGCHDDDDPTNARLENLRWDTHSGNMRDCVRNGRHVLANKTACKLEHELRVPNLKPSGLRRGHRHCLACSRAHERVRRNPNLDLRVEADRIYAELMSDAGPCPIDDPNTRPHTNDDEDDRAA